MCVLKTGVHVMCPVCGMGDEGDVMDVECITRVACQWGAVLGLALCFEFLTQVATAFSVAKYGQMGCHRHLVVVWLTP